MTKSQSSENSPAQARVLNRIRGWIRRIVILLALVLPIGLVLRLEALGPDLKADLRFWYVWVVGYLIVALIGTSFIYAVHWAEARGWIR